MSNEVRFKQQQTYEREPARRVFATELREATYHFKDGEDEKSPAYVLLPTGERCNRIFIIGSMTQKEKRGEQNLFYQFRVADPTGIFFVSASSFQQEAMQQVSRIEPPAFVAVVGKPSVYETPDGRIFVSVRAESVTVVDKEMRDCWVLDAAENTLKRIEGFDQSKDAALTQEHYPALDLKVYRQMAYEALRQINL
ncbi:nucleic acid-binding protein [Methanofollis aquaemaris]|uniref:Nucleic acid-binding protein n=1 Tax=Methanofollis aquaemaris TaxID=126734 RepID=A0A8A3S7F0_9EURY|nr:nucleic acid-binding protein [Methanofollis aquaemaris]QSZ67536.1 nucleic acid-binding protein [Methanofollis aquaemaris]